MLWHYWVWPDAMAFCDNPFLSPFPSKSTCHSITCSLPGIQTKQSTHSMWSVSQLTLLFEFGWGYLRHNTIIMTDELVRRSWSAVMKNQKQSLLFTPVMPTVTLGNCAPFSDSVIQAPYISASAFQCEVPSWTVSAWEGCSSAPLTEPVTVVSRVSWKEEYGRAFGEHITPFL